jgi:hypothetical protein
VSTSALGSSPYLLSQIATAQSEMNLHDTAIASFQLVHRADPYRLDQMNIYSDSLYIRVSEFAGVPGK